MWCLSWLSNGQQKSTSYGSVVHLGSICFRNLTLGTWNDCPQDFRDRCLLGVTKISAITSVASLERAPQPLRALRWILRKLAEIGWDDCKLSVRLRMLLHVLWLVHRTQSSESCRMYSGWLIRSELGTILFVASTMHIWFSSSLRADVFVSYFLPPAEKGRRPFSAGGRK